MFLTELVKHQVKHRATDGLAAWFVQTGALVVLEAGGDVDEVQRRLLSLAGEVGAPETTVAKIARGWAELQTESA